MQDCIDCGKKQGWLEPWYNGRCSKCQERLEDKKEHHIRAQNEDDQKDIHAIVLTTETAANLKITKRIEVITAEVAYGMNIFKDLFAGVRNVVGGRSAAVQQTMRDARRTALFELKKEAYEVGANVVVGVDLDYVELAGTGSSMVMLVASGTAVIVENE